MSARLLNVPRGAGAARSFLLSNWVTVRGSSTVLSVTQDADEWLELPGFADATFFIDVPEITVPSGGTAGLVLLYLETAPTRDEALFTMQPLAGPIPLATTSTTPLIVKSASAGGVPLCRYVRWRLVATVAASWDVTIRIRAVANRSGYFAPTRLGQCMFWVRADRGLTFSGNAVTAWADQSGANDANRNLTAGSAPPTINTIDGSYGSQMTMSYSNSVNSYFYSGTWATTLAQPHTWVIVGHRNTASNTNYAFDGIASGFAATVIANNTGGITMGAGGSFSVASCPWTAPSAVLAEFNTTSSNVFYDNFTTASGTGNAGTASCNGISLGSHSIGFGGGSTWGLTNPPGTMAEVMAFSGLLSAAQKSLLRQYLNQRYALSIT